VRLSGSRIKVVTEAFILQATSRGDDGAPAIRIGFTASRKVGGAVVRNRARRRLKALAAAILPRRGTPGWDYVLVARGAAVKRPWAALVGDLEGALERIGARP
jgi:ribonuclease P protein component